MEHEDLHGPRVLQIPKVSQKSDHLWQLVLHSFAHPQLILVWDELSPPGSCPLPPAFTIYHFDNIM